MKIQYYISILLLILFTSCNKTNWYENYREKEKSPFGTYIVFNEAKELFNNNEVELLQKNIYDYLIKNYEYQEKDDFGNYICIKSQANKLNGDGLDYILKFVYEGNNAFISLNYFNDKLKEYLDFNTHNNHEHTYYSKELKKLNGTLHLENTDFKKQDYKYDRNLREHYFTQFNENKTKVLGTQKINGIDEPVFIKIYYGKGAIYLHSQPIVFTNYYLLKDNYKYAQNVFSYLPDRKILWDPHIRSSELSNSSNSSSKQENESVFNFFLQNSSLKWSLFVFLFGLLTFMLFNARRKQRPIPIINELKNSTVEFTHTIANLYLKENDHKNLVDKKIQFFLEKVRNKYLIDTRNLDDEFIEKLALKSGNSIENTNYLIKTIISLNKKHECTQDELQRLNNLIENFFNKNTHGSSK